MCLVGLRSVYLYTCVYGIIVHTLLQWKYSTPCFFIPLVARVKGGGGKKKRSFPFRPFSRPITAMQGISAYSPINKKQRTWQILALYL